MKEIILIAGGAGFVGSSLALMLKNDYPDRKITVLDNLKRRGSELNLPRLKSAGIEFIHGDTRLMDDLENIEAVEVIIDCAAEPSVLAGYKEAPGYIVSTNLNGTINCLELARKRKADVIFLSTSRVYPIETIRNLEYNQTETRFRLRKQQQLPGVSVDGITEQFPLKGVRSLYGASKLSSELIMAEYMDAYGISGIINRCSVLTGPWQMGKIDQGFVVLWVAKHLFGDQLSFIGFGGTGKQVRDILHIKDLYDILKIQLENFVEFSGQTFNIGGGKNNSISLLELTDLCQKVAGRQIKLRSEPDTRPGDIPWFISDCKKITSISGWRPKIDVSEIIEDISLWLNNHRQELRQILQ